MEKMGLKIVLSVNPDFWQDKRVLITGHTGFKGSWLSLWLQSMGTKLYGLALAPPTIPALFQEAKVASGMESTICDVRDFNSVLNTIKACRPEIVIHMAAQPLVRYSYQEPIQTYATNVMGTVHVLEATRQVGTVKAIVNVTTDKCYENKEWLWGYREDEPMGGYDPYSNSKGCSELVTSAYRQSFFQKNCIALASARAGNVIGGGDWANDRLIPDILRAFETTNPVVIIRNPQAIRPWQHVLEPLSGYLILAERLYEEGQLFAEGWNFGPNDEDSQTVQWIVERMVDAWGKNASWILDKNIHPHEANHLKLDISKARNKLGWQPRWNLTNSLDKIVNWHRAWLNKNDVRDECLQQINEYQQFQH
jgi:CDP-glucose 4,6-dehydratase